MNKKNIRKFKYYLSIISTVGIVISIVIVFYLKFYINELPIKNIPEEEYALTLPSPVENESSEITFYYEINTTIALFGINITYTFFNITQVNSINYSKEIETKYNIYIKEPYINNDEIIKKFDTITLRGIGSPYMIYSTSYLGEILLRYLENNEITIIGNFGPSGIDIESYVAIYIRDVGWAVNIFNEDIHLESIITNEIKIQEKIDEYNKRYNQYEKTNAQGYQFIALIISSIGIIMLIFKIFDSYYEYKSYDYEKLIIMKKNLRKIHDAYRLDKKPRLFDKYIKK